MEWAAVGPGACSQCHTATAERRHQLTAYHYLEATHPRRTGESANAHADRVWAEMNRRQREGGFTRSASALLRCGPCATADVLGLMGRSGRRFAAPLAAACSLYGLVGNMWSAIVAAAEPGADGDYAMTCVTGHGRFVPDAVYRAMRRQVDAGHRSLDEPARFGWLQVPYEATA